MQAWAESCEVGAKSAPDSPDRCILLVFCGEFCCMVLLLLAGVKWEEGAVADIWLLLQVSSWSGSRSLLRLDCCSSCGVAMRRSGGSFMECVGRWWWGEAMKVAEGGALCPEVSVWGEEERPMCGGKLSEGVCRETGGCERAEERVVCRRVCRCLDLL